MVQFYKAARLLTLGPFIVTAAVHRASGQPRDLAALSLLNLPATGQVSPPIRSYRLARELGCC